MRAIMIFKKVLILGIFLFSFKALSQDLKNELDALEDVPEEDLSELMQEPAQDTAKQEAGDALESLPKEEILPTDPPEQSETSTTLEQPAPENPAPPEVVQEIPVEAQGKVTRISFKQFEDRVRLQVQSDRPIEFMKDLRTSKKQVIVEMKNLSLARSILKRALDTGEFEGPVAYVQAYDSKVSGVPAVKVLFQLRTFVDPSILKSGNQIFVDFPIRTLSRIAQKDTGLPETFTSINNDTEFKGAKVSLNVKEAELQDVLNLISKSAGRSFVLSNQELGKAKVTMNVKNTPWDQVLAIVLLNANLGFQVINGTYRVMPLEALRTEIDAAAKTAKSAESLISVDTRLLPLSYAKASDVVTNIKDFLTERGKVSVDARTNTVVISDIPTVIEKVQRYVRSIDKQTPQVLIEARIVEAQKNFVNDLKVNWGFGESQIPGGATTSLNSFVNVGNSAKNFTALRGKQEDAFANIAEGKMEGGMLDLRFGALGSLGSIHALLNMMESEEKIKVIASPRVTVLNNETASIKQGSQIQIPVQQADGVSTSQPKDIELALDVTPQITDDGFVLMKVDLKRDIPKGNSGNSETRKANSKMIVESGKTVVLGGVYSSDTVDNNVGWPFMKNLPILGVLFTDQKSLSVKTTELLMFISPKILNSDKALFTNEDRALGDGGTAKSSTEANSEQSF